MPDFMSLSCKWSLLSCDSCLIDCRKYARYNHAPYRRNAFTSLPFGGKLSPFYQCWSVSPVLNALWTPSRFVALLKNGGSR